LIGTSACEAVGIRAGIAFIVFEETEGAFGAFSGISGAFHTVEGISAWGAFSILEGITRFAASAWAVFASSVASSAGTVFEGVPVGAFGAFGNISSAVNAGVSGAWGAFVFLELVTGLAFTAFVFSRAIEAAGETGAFDDGGWTDFHVSSWGLAVTNSSASAGSAVFDAV
jgi:hypothetical protein